MARPKKRGRKREDKRVKAAHNRARWNRWNKKDGASKAYTIRLDPAKDPDIIAFLENNDSKTEAIKTALRSYLASKKN